MAPLEYFYSTPAPRAASRRLPGQTVDTAVLSDRPVPASDFPRPSHQNVHPNLSTNRAEQRNSVPENVQHHRLVNAVLRGHAALENDALVTSYSARPGVALALGGGFARGFAHLGVLQVFEENHIAISHIAGTSVGSILGAAYASGAPLAQIMATCRTLKFRDIARWHVSRLGLASNHRLADLIERVFVSQTFEQLRIPMAVVATNLNSGEAVVFTEGNMVDPIRASCAFPGIFEPVEIGTRWLVDGGLIAPVPTQAARNMGAKYVVGVSVGMPEGDRGKPTNIFQVVSRAVCAAQKHQLEMWERHADLIIRPDVHSLAWDDFHRADEAIEAGKIAAKIAVPRILKLLAENEAHEPRAANPAEFSDKKFSNNSSNTNGSHFITEAINS
ncbi:MAG TPA: patatin-like phospholipase family protein [Methylomirabilota bacterium]|jgi:NTE family protein|nr:patatin-like phospholipase family protein [Methylomirabilota bacterium]